jgi:hypothetical protein
MGSNKACPVKLTTYGLFILKERMKNRGILKRQPGQ